MKYLKKLKLKTLFCIAIISVIISTFFSLASYRSEVAGISNGKIASVALDINNKTSLTLPIGPIEPDNETSLQFEIFNKKKEKKNEVTMKYYLEIANNYSNLPLSFSLYRLGESNNYELLSLISNKTKEFYLGYSDIKSDKYKLVVNWNESEENYNDYKFSKSIDFITINVISEQVD